MKQKMTARATFGTGMRFEVRAGSGHHVTLDAQITDGGQDAGFRPMEMLLVGLAGCTGMDVISILRKKRMLVTDYEVRVEGIRSKTHPMVFTEITVEHVITGYRLQSEAVARAIELSERRYCGVGAMLGKTARLTHSFRILDAEASKALVPPVNRAITTLDPARPEPPVPQD
jgi:putative redox protein